ncbi:PP2C family protein-serine/threonine phosphatase [Tuwongella immobilis]|uniref:CBS domain-containing protein n=1 Tax=Tuwongella immobilis TaxID=692036 RepID=A0A6C2YSH9_9BACT|nr:SpoIIE family protein phosphatase [Tuwongella immobilis]VIP04648.1 stage ii sporulation protein e : Response regulator receiver modulated serine phosphatase OS=Heliobacterium modesticaldum (strain ATCC 51547 / Ice1) GN=HM1_2362 PE=4 SV=1: CBS: CBS: SpoIIE [Tuwongella immobilis]VTS06657.1 stage ii sporulation protein e : Response regulator receiver modulated serine phosphatase OS=Heliobacterium modesticaldum (strain ATCC 51547 / Ice1) GN=HM1_2362 PE=4 SV=1: CBS: CBS: SpoIIE [Tuwongella immobili
MQTIADLTVRQVMVGEPICVRPEESIQQVLRRMSELRIGAVLVTDDDQLLGIFTERDLLRHAAVAAVGWRQTPVAHWMTTDVYTISPDAGWEEAMSRLEQWHVRHLPVVEDGRVIGILSSRQLISRREEYLNQQIAERTREVRQANEELLARDAEMTHHLRMASRLMNRIVLPHASPSWPELMIGVEFVPLDLLGGDYYDFAYPDANHLGILMADASGHSLPAAMVAIMARIAFSEVAHTTIHPGEVLAAMNKRLQGLSDERFVTAFYGVIDRRNYRFTYANAGHPIPLLQRAKATTVEPLTSRGFMLGILPDEVYTERSIDLAPGDRLCMFTDGVVESMNDRGEMLGNRRFEAMVNQRHRDPVNGLASRLLGDVNRFRSGNPASDDITLMMVGLRESV